MSENPHESWDPRSPEVQSDQVRAYDELRAQCPVAHSEAFGWSLMRHADVVRALHDPETFSNAVSVHLNVPNGMDPPEHTRYREIVDRYFTAELVGAFEPDCRAIARELVADLPRGEVAFVMTRLAEPFALRVQTEYLGWPRALTEPLRDWAARSRDATASGDRSRTAAVAAEFDAIVTAMLDERRDAGPAAPDDLTTRLLHERIEGRPLSDEELVSTLRNWTAGELATIAASVGIVAHHLATRPQDQALLRAHPELVGPAVDEILRIHPPLISNRRVTTCPVTVGGTDLDAGERVTLLWASANRDEDVFGDPDELRLDRDPSLNLLYGAGIHWCPGAPFARMELRVVTEELLAATESLAPAPPDAGEPERASYPASGFSRLPLVLT